MDGPALEIVGRDDLVENCYFYNIDYSNLGGSNEGSINLQDSYGLVFRRNTVHTAGNSEGVRVGRECIVELNRVWNMSLLQHDGN